MVIHKTKLADLHTTRPPTTCVVLDRVPSQECETILAIAAQFRCLTRCIFVDSPIPPSDQRESVTSLMPVTDRRGRQAAGVYQACPTRQAVYRLER